MSIGDVVEVTFANSNVAPVLGIITSVGYDSVSLIYFPKVGPAVARYSGAWNINDPRIRSDDGKVPDVGANRCLFKVLRTPMSMVEMSRKLDELQAEVERLNNALKVLRSAKRMATGVEQSVEETY